MTSHYRWKPRMLEYTSSHILKHAMRTNITCACKAWCGDKGPMMQMAINLKIQNSHNVLHNVENKVPIIRNFSWISFFLTAKLLEIGSLARMWWWSRAQSSHCSTEAQKIRGQKRWSWVQNCTSKIWGTLIEKIQVLRTNFLASQQLLTQLQDLSEIMKWILDVK